MWHCHVIAKMCCMVAYWIKSKESCQVSDILVCRYGLGFRFDLPDENCNSNLLESKKKKEKKKISRKKLNVVL